MLNRDFIKYAKEIDWAFPTPIDLSIPENRLVKPDLER